MTLQDLAEQLNETRTAAKEIRRINSLIRLFFCENPDHLSDEEWAMRDGELKYSLKITGKIKEEDGVTTFLNNGN